MSQSLAATIAANLQIVQHALSGSEPQMERIVLYSGGLHPAPDLRGDFCFIHFFRNLGHVSWFWQRPNVCLLNPAAKARSWVTGMSPPRWQSAQYGHISLSKLPPAEEPFSYFLVTFSENQSMLNLRSCRFTLLKCFTKCLWCFEANQSQITSCGESITRPVGKTKKRPHFFWTGHPQIKNTEVLACDSPDWQH